MKTEFYTDFLRDAQRLDPLHIEIPRTALVQSFEDRFCSFGSCFAQNLKLHTEKYGFRYWYNRDICGHYTAESIAFTLERLAQDLEVTEDHIYRIDGSLENVAGWRNFKMRMYGPNAHDRMKQKLQQLDAECLMNIKSCTHLILTLGTARVTRAKRDGKVLVHCDGVPSSEYFTELTCVEDNVRHLETIYRSIKSIRGGGMPNIVITLSPQRYLFKKDVTGRASFLDNQLCKSIVRVAIEKFVENHPGENIVYFPSYEIVMDELRMFESISIYDYCHINQDGTPKYVVKRFLKTYASDQVLDYLPLVESVEDFIKETDHINQSGLAANSKEMGERIRKMMDLLSPKLVQLNCPAITDQLANWLEKYKRFQEIVKYLDHPHFSTYTRVLVTTAYLRLERFEEAQQSVRKLMPLLRAENLESSMKDSILKLQKEINACLAHSSQNSNSKSLGQNEVVTA